MATNSPIEIVEGCFSRALKIVRRCDIDLASTKLSEHIIAAQVIAASNLAMVLASYELEHAAIKSSGKAPEEDSDDLL
jgi:hypothetical protein